MTNPAPVTTGGKTSGTIRFGAVLLAMPLVLWLFLLVILPHIDLLLVSLHERISYGKYEFSLINYIEFFVEPLYWNTYVRTAVMSIMATVLTLVIGFPVSYYIAKMMRGKGKSILFLLCLIPLFMVVPLVSVLDSLDDSLIEAGYDLGGNAFTVTRDIVIPHAMPGIASGCIVVFMLTLGNYLTPNLLGGKDSLWFTEQIYTQFITRFNWETGSAFGFLLLVLSSLIVWFGLKISRQTLSETVG